MIVKQFRRIGLVLIMSLAAAGCASVDRSVAMAPNIEVTDLETLPAPRTSAYYGVRPLETLDISVRQDESLDGTYVVDTEGNVEFPYIGSVPAAGLLPGELADRIERALDPRFVIDPDVVVRSTFDRQPTVSIGGQIGIDVCPCVAPPPARAPHMPRAAAPPAARARRPRPLSAAAHLFHSAPFVFISSQARVGQDLLPAVHRRGRVWHAPLLRRLDRRGWRRPRDLRPPARARPRGAVCR